jgi:hypothetical protein
MGAGVVVPDALLNSVTCRVCYADHTATVEYNAQSHCHFHFCSDAGLVGVDDTDLATLRFDPEWLLDWLARELPVSPRVQWRSLVSDQVWHLGDSVRDNVPVTVIFARQYTTRPHSIFWRLHLGPFIQLTKVL